MERQIESGDLFRWLGQQFEGKIDLSLLKPDVSSEMNEKLNDILGSYQGQEGRKWGIENNGLGLLLAWTNELIQRRLWKDVD